MLLGNLYPPPHPPPPHPPPLASLPPSVNQALPRGGGGGCGQGTDSPEAWRGVHCVFPISSPSLQVQEQRCTAWGAQSQPSPLPSGTPASQSCLDSKSEPLASSGFSKAGCSTARFRTSDLLLVPSSQGFKGLIPLPPRKLRRGEPRGAVFSPCSHTWQSPGCFSSDLGPFLGNALKPLQSQWHCVPPSPRGRKALPPWATSSYRVPGANSSLRGSRHTNHWDDQAGPGPSPSGAKQELRGQGFRKAYP